MKYAFAGMILLFALTGCKHDPVETRPVENTGGAESERDTICFNTQVLPLIAANCSMSGCHDADSHKGGYDLTTYQGIMTGMIPFKPAEGVLMRSLAETDPQRIMPPAGRMDSAKLALLTAWIKQGAKEVNCEGACDSFNIRYASHISVLVENHCLSCHGDQAADLSGGGMRLESYDKLKDQARSGSLLCAIMHKAGCVAMPYQQQQLDFCTIRVFAKWVETGCPK